MHWSVLEETSSNYQLMELGTPTVGGQGRGKLACFFIHYTWNSTWHTPASPSTFQRISEVSEQDDVSSC